MLAEIWGGYPLRTAAKAATSDDRDQYAMIRIGDLAQMEDEASGRISHARILVDPDEDVERFVVEQGDVLFRTRGTALAVHMNEVEVRTLAIAPVVLVRVWERGRLDPGFLAWWLNGPEVQEALSSEIVGSGLQAVPTRAIGEIEVPLPPLDLQHDVVASQNLLRLERRLLIELADARSRQARQGLTNAVRAAAPESFS